MASESCLPVKADKEYILFSDRSDHNYFGNTIDPLRVSTSLMQEINTLHIFFSEKSFYKPLLNEPQRIENYILPASLSRRRFESWISENKAMISDFQDYQIHIEILGEN